MYKYNSKLRHPSHPLAVYNFRFHSYIPRMYTTNVFQSHRNKKMGLKWVSQLIPKIWKLIYIQWLHRSKFKYAGGALENHTK